MALQAIGRRFEPDHLQKRLKIVKLLLNLIIEDSVNKIESVFFDNFIVTKTLENQSLCVNVSSNRLL
jgi:hypothetical protein